MYIITGVYDVGNFLVVHCVERDADTKGNRKTAVVLVKSNSEKAKQCIVGTTCRVKHYKYNDNWYKYIEI